MARRMPRSPRNCRSGSRCTTTPGAAEATAATLCLRRAGEIEDIEALIVESGGSAHLYGVFSGGALVLEAGRQACGYEVPYSFAGDKQEWRAYVEQVDALLTEGRRDDALAHADGGLIRRGNRGSEERPDLA